MYGATEAGAIPAKVFENRRPMVTAGLANDVDRGHRARSRRDLFVAALPDVTLAFG